MIDHVQGNEPFTAVTIELAMQQPNGKARLTARFADGTPFTDTLNLGVRKARDAFREKVCEGKPGIAARMVDEQLEKLAADLPTGSKAEHKAPNVLGQEERTALLDKADSAVDDLLRCTDASVLKEAEEMLRDPRLMDVVFADIETLGVVGEQTLASTVYLIATSRLLPKPLSAIIQSATCTGKSFVIQRCQMLFPDEAVLAATDITPNALYYAEPGTLMHKFVSAGERPRAKDDERAEATRALREMIEAGNLSKFVPMKGPDGRQKSIQIRQFGPIAYIESTTAAHIFDEDRNRCLLLSTDESKEQTARIVCSQGREACSSATNIAPLCAKHHALQRKLRRVRVSVPFARALGSAIPTERHEARRVMPMLLNWIRAVALLHQRQRSTTELQHGGQIEATLDDYTMARELMIGPIGGALGGGLPTGVAAFGERLSQAFGPKQFSSTDALENDAILNTKGKVNEYLVRLRDVGVVTCVSPARGANPATWQVIAPKPKDATTWLPTIDQIRGSS